MAADEAMRQAVRLGASADALAALAAAIRLDTEQLPADRSVRDLLTAIRTELVGDGVPGPGAPAVVGLARTFLRQAAELIEDPGRSGGWDRVDVPLLQSIGRLSMGVADALRAAEERLPEFGRRMQAPGARFLDVGTGTGWLAIAVARSHPGLTVVGIDVFAPALELARGNVAAEGMDGRVELRHQDAARLDEPEAYEVVWLPMPFLPQGVVPAVVDAAVQALRPGGWLVLGTFTGPGDRLSELLTDLRTVRSGGHPWRPAELVDLLTSAELADAGEVDRAWAAPVRLYAGRRAG
jgi:2-polyprenyl-3-methyl-5-hydroxy-6-metoxy-1,4-benzoquinol methylase